MNGNLFLRTGMVFLAAGVGLGMYMGINEDFAHVPVHVHLNLVGGVWMFLAGLFYNAHPQVSRKGMWLHYILSVIGMPLFAIGLWGTATRAPWFPMFIMPGSTLSSLGLLTFMVMVFLGTGKKKP